jgi:hypothetical protein
MQRRSWLKLGLASAAVLAVGGGAVALLEPGLRDARLSAAGRLVFTHVGRAVLEGSLPAGDPAQARALEGLLTRIDALVAALPPHAQGELSQLLALLASSAGRRTLAGLASPWEAASVQEIQAALQSMRVASISLRQQAYHALHDITLGAYFSDPGTWAVLGYPGPPKI